VRVPRTGALGLDGLVPGLVAALQGRIADHPLPLRDRPDAVVLLVVDGLGRRLLDRHRDVAPTLAAAPGTTLDAPFPTTTATSLTTLGTARSPGEHGIVGYALRPPSHERRLVTLTWSWDRQDLGRDARDEVVPEALQPHEPWPGLGRDLPVATVLRPEFAASGLTRAALRGAAVHPAAGLDATLEASLRALADGARLVYAHHGDLDATGHLLGPGHERWCEELARVDDALAAFAARLPAGVVAVVTADHGMVAVPPDGFVELADEPTLLEGVRLLAGEGRARALHVEPGAADDVAAAWRAHVGDRGVVATRDEAVEQGWFGPRVTDRVRPLLGDVVVAATVPGVSWVHRDEDAFGGRLAGQHGALTDDEVQVPAIVLAADR
jgi:hypothetical protein